MKKIKVITMNGIETLLAEDTQTVRELLEAEDITFQGRVLTLNGYTMSAGDLNLTVGELIDGDKGTIGIAAKTENAATATVLGNAFVVTSALKRDDLETIKKYRPAALTAYEKDEDGNKEPVFKIGLSKSNPGEISQMGAIFGEVTDDEGHARLTISFTGNPEKEEMIDRMGPAIIKLNKMEEDLAEVLGLIAADKEAAKNAITFA